MMVSGGYRASVAPTPTPSGCGNCSAGRILGCGRDCGFDSFWLGGRKSMKMQESV